MNLKILYYTDYDLSVPDGPTINELEFIESLVICDNTNIGIIISNTEPIEKYNLKNIYKTRKLNQNPYIGIFSGLLIALKIFYIFKKNKYQLLVIRLPHMPWPVYFLSRFTNIPFAIKTAGMFWNLSRITSIRSKVGWLIQEYLSVHSLKNAIFIDSVTNELATEIKIRTGYKNIEVIPNATNISKFKPKDDLGDKSIKTNEDLGPVLGYVGLYPSKRAMQQLIYFSENYSIKYPKLKIIIAGWDDDMAKMIKLIERKKLDKYFEILGLVDYQNIPQIINQLDVGISFDDVLRAKKVGNSSQKVRQYLACGKPVVAMDIGNEFIRENDLGILAPPDDYKLIAIGISTIINKLQSNKNIYRKRCREYAVNNLSTTHTLKQRLEYWCEALKSNEHERIL